MNLALRFVPLAALLAIPVVAAADSELEALRAENAALKTQLHQLQASCPAQALSPAPAVAAPVAPAAVAPTVSAPPAPPTPPPGYKLVPAAPAASAPPGYKLVPLAPPHSESGCSTGFFKSGPDAPWKHEENWLGLARGLTPKEVESLLGDDHFDVSAKGMTAWQYGKCGNNVQGQVVFKSGEVLYWTKPDF